MEGTMHPDTAELAAIPLFGGLSDDKLAAIATHFEVMEIPAGKSPAEHGQHGYSFFVLASGSAHVEDEGRILERLEPGAMFGEMAFFTSDSRRTATVVPETDVRLFWLFGTDFLEMERDYPEIAQRVKASYDERHARDVARAGGDQRGSA
jgi:CRP-like cAMP-binding protein